MPVLFCLLKRVGVCVCARFEFTLIIIIFRFQITGWRAVAVPLEYYSNFELSKHCNRHSPKCIMGMKAMLHRWPLQTAVSSA